MIPITTVRGPLTWRHEQDNMAEIKVQPCYLAVSSTGSSLSNTDSLVSRLRTTMCYLVHAATLNLRHHIVASQHIHV